MIIDFPLGTKITDIPETKAALDVKLSDYGFALGDLVRSSSCLSGGGLTLYRITKDFSPRTDAIWGSYTKINLSRSPRIVRKMGWVKPGTHTAIPKIRLRGSIEITPAFQFISGPITSKHTIGYCDIFYKLEKVDVLTLAKSFSDFQEFIKKESKRFSNS